MKKTRKKIAPATPAALTALDVINAMLLDAEESADIRQRLQVVEPHLRTLVKDGFNDCRIEEQAAEMLLEVSGRTRDKQGIAEVKDILVRIDRMKMGEDLTFSSDDVSAIGSYTYLVAGGSFALGFAAGMRLGGGGR